MSDFTIFASTCSSLEDMKKTFERCHALELKYPCSNPITLKADTIKNAIRNYQQTDAFIKFVNGIHIKGEIYFFECSDLFPCLL